MKAEELRIGNYVSWRKKPRAITRVCQSGLVHTRPISLGDINDIEPIPLDEEWLKKLGFECHDEGEYYTNQKIHIESRDTDKYLSEETRNKLKGCFGVWLYEGDFLIEAKYVHQLQNLFYALSGKELVEQ